MIFRIFHFAMLCLLSDIQVLCSFIVQLDDAGAKERKTLLISNKTCAMNEIAARFASFFYARISWHMDGRMGG